MPFDQSNRCGGRHERVAEKTESCRWGKEECRLSPQAEQVANSIDRCTPGLGMLYHRTILIQSALARANGWGKGVYSHLLIQPLPQRRVKPNPYSYIPSPIRPSSRRSTHTPTHTPSPALRLNIPTSFHLRTSTVRSSHPPHNLLLPRLPSIHLLLRTLRRSQRIRVRLKFDNLTQQVIRLALPVVHRFGVVGVAGGVLQHNR